MLLYKLSLKLYFIVVRNIWYNVYRAIYLMFLPIDKVEGKSIEDRNLN